LTCELFFYSHELLSEAVYFSGFRIWECVSAHGGQSNFSFSIRQCTLLQQNGKYNNIPTILVGALLSEQL